MIYVLYGSENKLIEDFIKKIKSDNNIETVINYNLLDCELVDIIEDAKYASLFEDKKLIVVDNSDFLKNKKSEDEDDSKDDNKDGKLLLLENYINNPNENNILVFVLNQDSIDSRKKIVKLLKEKCNIKEFNKLKDYELKTRIKEELALEDYKIDDLSINEIIIRCNSNYSMIYNEIEKLKMLKIADKVITMDNVKDIVSKNIESDIFKLTDAILEKNKNKVINIYNDLIYNGTDPFQLIAIIESQMRLINQIYDLKEVNFKGDISNHLNVNPYRVKLALGKINYFSKKEVEDILIKLYNLNYEIVSGKVDRFVGFELFLFDI